MPLLSEIVGFVVPFPDFDLQDIVPVVGVFHSVSRIRKDVVGHDVGDGEIIFVPLVGRNAPYSSIVLDSDVDCPSLGVEKGDNLPVKVGYELSFEFRPLVFLVSHFAFSLFRQAAMSFFSFS